MSIRSRGQGAAARLGSVAALTALGVLLVGAASLGTRSVLAEADGSRVPNDGLLCEQYRVLVGHLDGDGVFATQASVRAARKLSDLADDAAASTVQEAGADMRTVMSSVAWETGDLLTSTRPIALACGWQWPVGAAPPAATPRPPAS